MTNQTPLNPDALEAAADELWAKHIDYEGLSIGYYEASELVVSTYLAVAQPVVNSVESLPAKMRMLMWEGGEFEVGEIPEGHVLVGFEMETDRAWSMADKVTINIERPEVKP